MSSSRVNFSLNIYLLTVTVPCEELAVSIVAVEKLNPENYNIKIVLVN